MTEAPAVDPRWAKLLSLTVHEFRTPMTVVSGYIRMLLQEYAGPLTDRQRKMLEEAEKSYGRLTVLVSEISELSNLESGTLTFNKHRTDLRAAVRQAAEQAPPLADREIAIDLQLGDGAAEVHGDPIRLAKAFTSILAALRRELVASDRLIVREVQGPSRAPLELRIGDDEVLAAFDADPDRPTFDEWREGVGLSLAIARRLIEKHGGRLSGAPGGRKAGAAIVFQPLS